ncbi:MAG: GntR family transcriptional regulator [Chloroflexota bacterium]
MRELNRSRGVALYCQLEEALRERMESEEFELGGRFPTEDELIEQYQISRITVRRALSDLVDEGYLVRRPGRGTFIRRLIIDHGLDVLLSFTEQTKAQNKEPSSKVLALRVEEPSIEVRESLALDKESRVILIKRIRMVDSEPVALEWLYFPQPLCAPMMDKDWAHSSVVEFLEKHFGSPLDYSDIVLEARSAKAEETEMLDIPVGAPVLVVLNTDYLLDGRSVCCGHTSFRGDAYRFHSRVRRSR